VWGEGDSSTIKEKATGEHPVAKFELSFTNEYPAKLELVASAKILIDSLVLSNRPMPAHTVVWKIRGYSPFPIPISVGY
jgi:hypothetical protein